MELRQLVTFCQVAEQESFTKAAEALFLTQAAVSQQIKALEQELGVRLFERGARGIPVTDAGRELHRHATDLIRRCQEMKEAVGQAAQALTGAVKVAASTVPGEHLLPERLSRFRAEHPQVRATMVISDSENTLEEVAAGRVDLAVVGMRSRSEKLECEEFAADRLVVIAPRGHPWTRRRKPVAVSELVEAPFVLRAPGSGTRQCLAEALEAVGSSLSELNVAMELGSSEVSLKSAGDSGDLRSETGALGQRPAPAARGAEHREWRE